MDSETTWKHRQELVSALRNRIDDHSERTRMHVVNVLHHVLTDLSILKMSRKEDVFSDSDFKQITNALLERFDDGKDEVRELTSGAVRALVECLDDRHQDLYGDILDTALLHLDDRNERLQQQVADLLQGISGFNKTAFMEKVQAVDTQFVGKRTLAILTNLKEQ